MRFLPDRIWWQRVREPVLEWAAFGILAAVLIGPPATLGWMVFFTDTFRIHTIEVAQAREQTAKAVERALTPIQGKRIFFAQLEQHEHDIERDLPQVRDVHIIRKLPGTVRAVIQEKDPRIILISGNTYYLVDKDGQAYEQTTLDNLPGTVLPRVRIEQEDISLSAGDPAVSSDFISFVHYLHEHLPNVIDAHIVETRIPSLAAREVSVELANNWRLRFDTTRNPDRQLTILERVLDQTISEEAQNTLQYIDLRIPGRVYYRTGGS